MSSSLARAASSPIRIGVPFSVARVSPRWAQGPRCPDFNEPCTTAIPTPPLTESLPLDSRYLLSPGHLVVAMDTELGRKICVIAFALALLPACDDSKSKGVVYTLYRNSPTFA